MFKDLLTDKTVLITGGTGSLAKVLVRRLLDGGAGAPAKIILFSRDEGKQHALRVHYAKMNNATDEILYNNFNRLIEFRIGDVRDFQSMASAMQGVDVVVNTAALKQVPACEYFPYEAVQTNIMGAENILQAIRIHKLPVETVVCVSTDKACKPVNVMGMTKAVQERILLSGNIYTQDTRFVGVRYGNVLASRGSVVPLFYEQISHGGPVTITDEQMTRFLLSLDDAVDIVFKALKTAQAGEMYIPIVPAAKVTDIAAAMIGDQSIETKTIGVRPGEKIHEILISEEEAHSAFKRNDHYVIPSRLPELGTSVNDNQKVLESEYSSGDDLMNRGEVEALLRKNKLMSDQITPDTFTQLAHN